MPFVTIALFLCTAPVTALVVLAASGLAAPWAAAAAVLVTILPAALFSMIWARDLDLLTSAVREIQAGGGDTGTVSPGPVLMEPMGLEIARLSRHLAAAAARTERERRADALVLTRLPEPVVVLREDLTVSRTNASATRMFGNDLPAVLRHPALRAAIAGASATPASVDISTAGPVARELLATVVALDPPTQDGGQIVIVLSDRTRERTIERNHAEFVANVSHELRTPLASMIGFTETLLGPARDDPEARDRFLRIMAGQGARMNRLVDDLLSLSRIETIEHQPPADRVELPALLGRFAESYEPRRASAGVRLQIEVAPDVPAVTGDSGQLTQVVQNLVDNAVKYGNEQGTVRLTAAPAEPGGRFPARPGVVVAVRDEGAGIPAEAIPRLTERFYRVDKGRSRAAGGTGLGLAIVKHIVNRHRGQLLIESEEGKGTTVSVWLPVREETTAVED